MTNEQREWLHSLPAATCDVEELNRAALMAAGWTVKRAGDDVGISHPVYHSGWHKSEDSAWAELLELICPVSDSDWAAGFMADRLADMSDYVPELSAMFPPLCVVPIGTTHRGFRAVKAPRLTYRAALCECVCRAYLAWWQVSCASARVKEGEDGDN